ncbi:hypothetical protein BUALT_Bualt13G0090500 [Buddleja alternifolia]|uniref:Uncharacterized protein n=1 Tax=Buddleja alternifolia TaxID=168488 RepID=A0AAV6WLP0_9LAMI|nr:hypothetical protein BUALT_Bualt13G0090500 [Buddleja alternifolia]
MATAMVLDPKPSLLNPSSTLHTPSSHPDDDLYSRLKSLQRQQEFIAIQEKYVKDELNYLHCELQFVGGGEEDSIGAFSHRPIHGDDRSEQRYLRVDY